MSSAVTTIPSNGAGNDDVSGAQPRGEDCDQPIRTVDELLRKLKAHDFALLARVGREPVDTMD